jgi:hypothetical protein
MITNYFWLSLNAFVWNGSRRVAERDASPTSGGASPRWVAVSGLAGALAVANWRRAARPEPVEAIAPPLWSAALASGTLTVVAPIAAAPVGSAVAAGRGGRAGRLLLLLFVVGPAAVLVARSDIHGAALAAGLASGVALPSVRPR